MSKDKNHTSPLDNPSLKKSVFQVPTDYFDQLEGRVMDNINSEEGELANAEYLKNNVFKVPEGYFGQLENRITKDIEKATGVLDSNQELKAPIFTVPEGYFDTLEDKVKTKLGEEATKVIPLYQKNWFRLTVAAMLAIGVFLGISDSGNDINPSEISSDLMIDYLIEEADFDYELMAMSSDFESIIDNILIDETDVFDFGSESNLELEYDFEYFEQ